MSDSSSFHLPLLQPEQPSTLKRQKALIISGPTATGKTALSLEIAKALDGEIISADSMQVYKHMDIGTAKATRGERDEIPHHLIDILDLKEGFNVVEFYVRAVCAMQEILSRDKVPIIVGGTGFYIHTLIYGPPLGPPADSKVRTKLEEDIGKYGPEVFYDHLCKIDPEYAKTISRNDKHKLVRAFEIISLTNKKVSDFKKSHPLSHPQVNFRCWFLHYPKEVLYPRIEDRCETMLANGFLKEVKDLKNQGLEQNTSAAQAIGYKQALEFLKTPQSESDYGEFVWSFKKMSKRYAKRQFTWFRKEPLFRWLNLAAYDPNKAVELIIHDFENSL